MILFDKTISINFSQSTNMSQFCEYLQTLSNDEDDDSYVYESEDESSDEDYDEDFADLDTRVFTFGKYKYLPVCYVKEVDPEYFEHCIDQDLFTLNNM